MLVRFTKYINHGSYYLSQALLEEAGGVAMNRSLGALILSFHRNICSKAGIGHKPKNSMAKHLILEDLEGVAFLFNVQAGKVLQNLVLKVNEHRRNEH